MDTKSGRPRVLIFSLRNIFGNTLFRCPHYEFEDLICEIDSAVLWAPEVDWSNTRSRFVRRVVNRAPLALNPGIRRISDKIHIMTYFLLYADLPPI